ncbi:unnamed protein product [Closterium sp. Naga37s-1]|nr:unnamed protein product [Closterium sp. Naga37s-1]
MQSTSAPGGPHSANRATGGAAAPPPAHGPPMSAGGGDHPHGAGGGMSVGGAAEAGALAQAGAGSTAGVAELSKAAARRVVDLRSDTVTKPTGAMREAMKNAEVDDDVIGIDPTVDRLQRQVATMMGKEAGLFVPSGTMGNLICVLVHCEVRGSEVIMGADSHISVYEQGGVATLGSVHPRTVVNKADGTMDLKKVELAIRKDDEHYPVTRCICLENTHNRCGGRAITVDYTERLAELASWYGLKFHIDGARIFNAAVALRVPVDRLVRPAHSVSVCLSKGLGAPAGSVIVGSVEFIAKARRLRKALGGSMRQVGVLAAAGLVALQESVPRLIRDHQRAMQLAVFASAGSSISGATSGGVGVLAAAGLVALQESVPRLIRDHQHAMQFALSVSLPVGLRFLPPTPLRLFLPPLCCLCRGVGDSGWAGCACLSHLKQGASST